MVINIIPLDDLREHDHASTCPCQPAVAFEPDRIIIRHGAWDGREAMEELNVILGKSNEDGKKWAIYEDKG